MSNDTSNTTGTVSQSWVAFGPAGALGSIHKIDGEYAMKLLNDDEYRGNYPSLDVAKHALHSALLPGSEFPEFREH